MPFSSTTWPWPPQYAEFSKLNEAVLAMLKGQHERSHPPAEIIIDVERDSVGRRNGEVDGAVHRVVRKRVFRTELQRLVVRAERCGTVANAGRAAIHFIGRKTLVYA